ncbi:MAG: hypothetical protein MI919_37445, partial [Holophagales bacterium]|nr:hypothetical protein [Holophagales bacterium]
MTSKSKPGTNKAASNKSGSNKVGASRDKPSSADGRSAGADGGQSFFATYRRELVFILLFVTIVGGGFT